MDKNVICPLCDDEGNRVEMESRDFSQKPLHDAVDRFPGAFVKMHNPATRQYDEKMFVETNLQVNWRCPVCDYRASE